MATSPRRFSAVLVAAFLPFAIAALVQGCKKDEPPPPMPATAEPSAPPPPAFTVIAPPDNSADDASTEDAKKLGVGKPPDLTGLRACCAALQGNAASMPPPQNMYAAAAASYCQATVNSVNTPGQKDALLAGIRNALRGAGAPAACH